MSPFGVPQLPDVYRVIRNSAVVGVTELANRVEVVATVTDALSVDLLDTLRRVLQSFGSLTHR